MQASDVSRTWSESAATGAARCCTQRDVRDVSDERFPHRVIKGGSHLCAPNYCLRYRVADRRGEEIDTYDRATWAFAASYAGARADGRHRSARVGGSRPSGLGCYLTELVWLRATEGRPARMSPRRPLGGCCPEMMPPQDWRAAASGGTVHAARHARGLRVFGTSRHVVAAGTSAARCYSPRRWSRCTRQSSSVYAIDERRWCSAAGGAVRARGGARLGLIAQFLSRACDRGIRVRARRSS